MACILHIETSTDVCSVALSEDGAVLFSKEDFNGPQHAVTLGVFIDEVLSMADSHAKLIDAVAVSCGPGSYTGLRIGVSTAKGLCYALEKPLIAISTLENIAAGYLQLHPQYTGYICPMIDARRMEVYSAIFDNKGNYIRPTNADIIIEDIYDQWLEENNILFIGDGADKTRSILEGKNNVMFDTDFKISAKGMALIAEKRYENKQFEDVAYFEPFYLKDFVAAKPSVKGLTIQK
jgi:tRNA threonylcarbamoyladenosine biosynthesis protein TsaB